GVSGKYISRIFKNEVQINVTDYIAYVRVQRIKELLASELPISRIAEMTGLVSRTSFIRTFKKIEGISPTEYRKRVQNSGQ
nr:helix-turn-helix domain-containing protein [Clostridia bacterium]